MSLGETYVTVLGWVGSAPDFKEVGGRTARTTFRVGSTPRQFDRAIGTWVDRTTTWFNVECWRNLAQNAFESVHIGQPIIITGRLRTHEWTDDAGEHRSRVVLEAFSLGHDLTRGTTRFSKNPPRSETATTAGDSGPASATAGTFERIAAAPTALTAVPSSTPAEASASPYPADEYSATPLPLTSDPQAPESAAA